MRSAPEETQQAASLRKEMSNSRELRSRTGFKSSKVFSTNRNLPGVVTALSLLRGGRSLPEAFTTSILPSASPLPVFALFTRGRS
jgi:hypothetical protein